MQTPAHEGPAGLSPSCGVPSQQAHDQTQDVHPVANEDAPGIGSGNLLLPGVPFSPTCQGGQAVWGWRRGGPVV